MSQMSYNPLSGNLYDAATIRQDCLDMRINFSDHYSAKPVEQEVILDYALRLQQEDIIVELGVCNGQTAAMLARSCAFTGARYIGVDFFGLENSKLELDKRFEALNLNGTIIHATTQDFGRSWAKYKERIADITNIPDAIQFCDQPISLLFIDAGHDEANVKADIEIWLPLVKPGGVVIFHDYDDPYNPQSPHEAVRRYADLATGPGTGWECQIKHSLLIARKLITKD